jgi:hypothetical protein
VEKPSNVTDIARSTDRASHVAENAKANADALTHADQIASAVAPGDDNFASWIKSKSLVMKLARPVIDADRSEREVNRDLHTPLSRERAYLNTLKRFIENKDNPNLGEKFSKYLPAIDARIEELKPLVIGGSK